MIKVSVFIATSLDGFIARQDGRIDWLENANTISPAEEDFGYNNFFESVDTLVMGRKTFATALTFDSWPYGDKKVLVLSNTLSSVPIHLQKTVSIGAGSPKEILRLLENNGSKHIYLDGGMTIQGFLSENLVNEMTITKIPILIGAGRPLFANFGKDIPLVLLEARSYPNGFVSLKYKVRN